ncbi:MAG: T9SS type A sorting domain-containing protein [Bacteroidetes bacterium]|nr:T9SS type A sorting domain-containing protein [Bacteroidota bacterium]
MKKTILSIICAFAFSTIYAQPNFTSSDMPNIGDRDTLMYLSYHAVTNNLDTETGNGYNWNFSSLPFNVQKLIDVDSFRIKTHAVSSPFTKATIEEYSTGTTGQKVNLYSYSNDTLYTHRLGDISAGTNYVPPIGTVVFPILFNNTSTINAFVYSSSVLVGERKTTTLYDGFGTLNMPNGKSYSNVFRVKKIERDTAYSSHAVNTYTSYIWYKQGGQVPLLRLTYAGVSNLYFVFGSKSNNTSTGIKEINELTAFLVYPNPFSSQTTLHTDNTLKNAILAVYNSLGEQVKQINNISGQTITLSRDNLPGGLYFIQLMQANKTIITDKLIITD